MQVRHLNRGAFGMVVLAKDRVHGDLVALKYIARGAEVRRGSRRLGQRASCSSSVRAGRAISRHPTRLQAMAHGEFCITPKSALIARTQHISKYTEREIVNHMKLHHPHVIALQEVRCAGRAVRCAAVQGPNRGFPPLGSTACTHAPPSHVVVVAGPRACIPPA